MHRPDDTGVVPSSPTKGDADMSVDTIIPPIGDSEAGSTVTTPVSATKKKLSKRQKKAEAKRVAAANAANAQTAEEQQDVVEEASSAAGVDSSAPASAADSPAAPPVLVKSEPDGNDRAGRKDGKHGRDEDEEAEDTADGEAVAAKKARADVGEPVLLDKVKLESDPVEPDVETASTAPGESDKEVKVESTAPLREPSLPPKPASTATSGSKAKNASTPQPNRESSRLRIYFSSPVSSASAYLLQKQDAHKLPPTGQSKETTAEPAGQDRLVKERVDESTAGAQVDQEEDVDGAEIDGEPVNDGAVDSDGANNRLVESALLPARPSDSNADATDIADSQGSASPLAVKIENASYPPDPYSLNVQTLEGSVAASEMTHDDRDTSLAPSEMTGPPIMPPPEPSADRISISYARNTRRIVLDAEVVETVKIFRAEGKIELSVVINPAILHINGVETADEFRLFKGVIVSLYRFTEALRAFGNR